MERFLTVAVASFCAAPLFFVLTIRLIEPLSNHFLPAGLGNSLDRNLLLSAGLALVGFVLIGSLSWYFTGHGYLRPIQMASGLMLAGWSLAGVVFFWKEPRKLDYDGQRAVLEAEIRVSKALLGGQPVSEAVRLSYTGGDFDRFYPQKNREEGEFIILPWEITVHTVYEWAIWSTVSYQKSYFPLKLPYRPAQSTDWSEWVAPMPHKSGTTPDKITLRYRLRLIPQKLANPGPR